MIATLPCPCCGSNQVQLCIDTNNAMKDKAKCRECGITGLVSARNRRTTPDREAVIPSDAAIDACALMIQGICLTRPRESWVSDIESRIRFMLRVDDKRLAALDRLAENERELGLGYEPMVADASPWVRPADRLPEQNQVVLITGFSRCRGELTNVRFTEIAMHMDGVFYNDETGDDFYPPTHWMAMPAAPTDAANGEGERG